MSARNDVKVEMRNALARFPSFVPREVEVDDLERIAKLGFHCATNRSIGLWIGCVDYRPDPDAPNASITKGLDRSPPLLIE